MVTASFPFDHEKLVDAVTWLLLELGERAAQVRPRRILDLLWTVEVERLRDCHHSMIGGVYEIDYDGPVLADAAAVLLRGEKRGGRRTVPSTSERTPMPRVEGDKIVTVVTAETFFAGALSRADRAHLDWTLCRYGTGDVSQARHAPLVRMFGPEPIRRQLSLSEVLDTLGVADPTKKGVLDDAVEMRHLQALFGELDEDP